MNQIKDICAQNTQLICNTLESVGFSVNKKKSVCIPCQRIVFFGFIVDSVLFMVFLTEEKIEKILSKARALLQKPYVVIQDLASFIGSIINAFYAVLEAPMHYRNLERDKILGLDQSLDFQKSITLSEKSIEDLNWWLNNLKAKNGKQIRPNKVDFYCRTDASLTGFGCVDLLSGKVTQARWSSLELQYHINYLELLAIFFSLQTLYSKCTNIHIQFQCDSVTAVTYIQDMGGMASLDLDKLASDIWHWCLPKNIFISAVHIAGIDNTIADFYSRQFSDSTEWMLKPEIFKRLCRHFFTPDIDLFASRINKQLDCFVSWYPEPGAIFNDAFSVSWNSYKPYIFSPFALISKVVNKIFEDKVEKALVVLPYWKSQPWFPLMLPYVVSLPVRLPRHKDLLVLPHNGRVHPLGKSLNLIAVVLSGRHSIIEAFHQELLISLPQPGDQEHTNNTIWHGKTGIFGLVKDVKIPFVPLKR
jgi:hypothetical protein